MVVVYPMNVTLDRDEFSFFPKLFLVTLPPNVYPGDTLRVQAPDGKMNDIIVPQGLYPGDRFHVQFAYEESPPPAFAIPFDSNSAYSPSNNYNYSSPYGTSVTTNATNNNDTFEGMSRCSFIA